MRVAIVISALCFLAATPRGPAVADPFPDETVAVVLNRNIDMVRVKGGCYKMGGDSSQSTPNEKPVHEVCVKDFLIGTYPVTQVQWISVMGKNPSAHADCGENCPVENVSWDDAQEYIRRLNERTKKLYRLPTEAEWEYAARSGGKDETWAGTNDEKRLGDYAWYLNNARYVSHPAGTKSPNGLGLYDMTGNVWEWVADWYADDYYANSPKDDPKGPARGRARVLRGGYWGDSAGFSRAARRISLTSDVKGPAYGLRLALSAN